MSAAQDVSSALTLDNIRDALIRQEDTIIFSLLERAQFARNHSVYVPDDVPVPGYGPEGRRYSLLEYVLRETEALHAKVRRYTSPDEHPFYPGELPPMVLPPMEYPAVLAPCAEGININQRIMTCYLDDILPVITAEGDDSNYGSAATLDILCLQALSKRIHYGKFVAEAKFRSAKQAQYLAAIKAQDGQQLMALLTDESVERRVVGRVHLKAATFGQDLSAAGGSDDWEAKERSYKVPPEVLAALYDSIIMPLTKEVQVAYLLRRLDAEPAA